MKKWVKMRQTLLNELIADELYEYLKDRLGEASEKHEGRINKEVILAFVGSYGFVMLRDQGMLEICNDCDQIGVFRLVDRKDD